MRLCIHGEVCREYVRRFSHLCRKGLFSGGDGYACILSRDCPGGCRFYEPKRERTCRMHRDERGTWHCDNCDDSYRNGEGIVPWYDSWEPDFCPDCGALVIHDA